MGIETSCDETAAGVVDVLADGRLQLVANVVHSQVGTHAAYGGVVPEVASREHVTRLVDVVERAGAEAGGLERIEGIAVTRGPGLLGCLLVGLQTAKGLALARNLPWVGVHHLEGHLSAALLDAAPPSYPHVALVVSGGHTNLYQVRDFGDYTVLGRTRDDAAGEAFDKVAKILGLGYPGGIRIERAAEGGRCDGVPLPRGIPAKKSYEFSFSGLKTAAAQHVQHAGGRLTGAALRDFCASVQEAIADILSKKAVLAARRLGVPGVVLAGGVAANTRLRELLTQRCADKGLWAYLPPKPLCTDNGAMIAAAGAMRLARGEASDWETSARSRWPLTEATDASVPQLAGQGAPR